MAPVVENKGFGTAPVFFIAISTILEAILFLRSDCGCRVLSTPGKTS